MWNNFILTCSENCIISIATNNATTFAITDAKYYILVVTLSTEENAKLSQQLKSGLDNLIDLSFQGVNKLFALLFEDYVVGADYRRDFLPTLEIKDHNIMIDGQNFFNHILKKLSKDIWKHSKSYNFSKKWLHNWFCTKLLYFKECYEMVAIDLEHTLGHPLKMMKKAFCFTVKTCFLLEIFTFLSWLFGSVKKRFNFKNA